MPFDPSGNFTRDYDWTQDRNNGVKVRADRMDGEFNNFATAMNQVILRNGVAAFTGNVSMGGNSIVSLADGTVGTPAIRFLGSPTTGVYSPGLDRIALTASGTNRVEANATGVLTTGTFGHTGAASISGNATVGGTFGATGAATFGSTLGVTGAATVGGTLGVTGTLTAAGGIAMAGPLNFPTSPGIVSVNGATVLTMTSAGALAVAAGLSSTTFAASGAATFGSTLGVTGAATIGGSATVTGNLTVGPGAPATVVGISDNGTGIAMNNAAGGNFNIGLLAGVGSQLAYVLQRANSDMIFGTNNTERVRMTAAGRTGFNTNSPNSIVDIFDGTTGGVLRLSGPAASYGSIRFSSANASFLDYGATIASNGEGVGINVGDLRFSTGFAVTPVERLRITGTGNIGVNCTPVNKFQIAYSAPGSVPAAGASAHAFALGETGFGLAAGVLNTGNAYLQATRWDATAANYNLLLQPNGGSVGIGTTTPDVFARGYGKVFGVSGTSSTAIEVNAATGNTAYLDFGNNGARTMGIASSSTDSSMVTTGATPLILGTNGVTRVTVGATGDTAFTGAVSVGGALNVGTGGAATQYLDLNATNDFNIRSIISAVEQFRVQTSVFGTTIATRVAQPLSLATNSTDRLSIGATGQVYLNAKQSPTLDTAIGYLGIPSAGTKTSLYTCVLSDAGQHIVNNNNTGQITIPSNAAVAYPIGTTLTFVNIHSTACGIGINTDTLRLAGTATTGTRSLAQYGVATAIKTNTTEWIVSGPGLT